MSSTDATIPLDVPSVDTSRSPNSVLRPVGLNASRLSPDGLLGAVQTINRTVVLPTQLARCEESGAIDNFRAVAGDIDTPFRGMIFADHDPYVWLEAASFSLAEHPDSQLEAQVDAVVDLLRRAQDEDGYLNTYFHLVAPGKRWTDLATAHEMYNAGHLIQAGIAHRRATGRSTLLDIAVRYATHIGSVFGPGARAGADGHPELELALVELYRETGERRFLEQAQWQLDQRGQSPAVISGDSYHLDHEPVREQRVVIGHAVRALYLYIGMADVYLETGDETLLEALRGLWRDLQDTKVYVSGGAGSRWEGEAFGEPYELPNRRAYAETCAGIAHFLWAWRMLSIAPAKEYRDVLEHTLYNAVLPGLAADGSTFYYQNPLSDRGGHRRSEWFGVPCCPPNLARLFASIPAFVYSSSAGDVAWVHLYTAGSAQIALESGLLQITQRTDYPWQGDIEILVEVAPDSAVTINLPSPAWASTLAVEVNGVPTEPREESGYASLRRVWKSGDTISVAMDMRVRHLASHPLAEGNRGRVAIQRGPLLYCVEQADNAVDVWDISIPADAEWTEKMRDDISPGVMTLKTQGLAERRQVQMPLYRDARESAESPSEPIEVVAIPYFAWANREAGPMQVWIPVRPGVVAGRM